MPRRGVPLASPIKKPRPMLRHGRGSHHRILLFIKAFPGWDAFAAEKMDSSLTDLTLTG